MRSALHRTAALACVAATAGAAYWLDGSTGSVVGYLVLLAGATGLVLLRALPEVEADAPASAPTWARPATGALWLAAAVALAAYNACTVLYPAEWLASGPRQIGLWLASAACAVAAGHVWDGRPQPPRPRLYDQRDWIIVAALVAFGALARIADLASEAPGLSQDEAWPLSVTLEAMASERNAFGIDVQSMSGLYHWAVIYSLRYADWLGLGFVQTAKLPNALFGALAVGTVYLAVRVFSARAIAATAALLLVWSGWPWILSRLYYSYSGDLLWIGLTTWLAVLGFTSGRMSALAAAAFTAVLGAAWMKTASLAIPWLGLIAADFTLLAPRTQRRRWLLPLYCAVAGVVSLVPLVAQFVVQPDLAWRFGSVGHERALKLAEYGISSAEAYLYGLRGAFLVLQVQEADVGRHVVRLDHAALDLVTSTLATVGAVWALWHLRRERSARLAVLGFLLFLIPAVTSFPADGDPAASRRMVGSAFFVVWLAGCGAAVVAARTVQFRHRTALMLALAGISILLNVRAIRTDYFNRISEWRGDLGVHNVYLINAFRESSQIGPVLFHPTLETSLATLGMTGVGSFVQVNTPDALRKAVRDYCQRICTVILPAPSATDPSDTAQWINQLSDLIPPHAWTFGPEDRTGMPIYRRAQVRNPSSATTH